MTSEIDDLKERLTLEMNRANQAEKHAHLLVNVSIDCFRNAGVKVPMRMLFFERRDQEIYVTENFSSL